MQKEDSFSLFKVYYSVMLHQCLCRLAVLLF